uniref:E3 SUMO-protein ligase NSE2 n=1 Tax=Aceria tosichella TaxID=561515 RepID=A0A6G1SMH0_9ACAR
MDTLSEEIAEGKSLEVLKEYKKRIIDTAKHIKSNDATFNISTLPAACDDLTALMSNYTDLIRNIDAAERAFGIMKNDVNIAQELELSTFEELFKATVESQRRNSHLEPNAVSELKSFILPPAPRDEEVVVEAPTERTWPKDPITKTNIKKAVRNKVCNHIYDRASIENYIDQRNANHQRAPCPVAGCRHKNAEKKDLEPDDETNALIESLKDKAS